MLRSVSTNTTPHTADRLAALTGKTIGALVPVMDGAGQPTRVYMRESDIGVALVGVTDQFLANAETYHSHYFDAGHFETLLRLGLNGQVDYDAPLSILDVGSGSGNSVVAALKMFPNAVIYATDISPDLLLILDRLLQAEPSWQDRVVCVQLDLMNDNFVPASFDLVIGTSILHHLMDPEQAIYQLARTVRRSGHLIFTEPFEPGNVWLAATFRQLLQYPQAAKLPAATTKAFELFIRDVEARTKVGHVRPYTEHLDDKWLFTDSFYRRVAGTAGATAVNLHSPHGAATFFQAYLNIVLSMFGADMTAVPDWLCAPFQHLDETLSDEAKAELAFTKVVHVKM